MKRLKNYFKLQLIFIFCFSFLNTFAHFGSKGPYGGTVSCSITYDTTVYIGTAEGGVFESTTSKLVAWRARPVGLKSGKITALAHSGKYLYAGTADSGIYIFNGYDGSDRYWKKINSGLTNLKIQSLIALDSVTLLAGTEGDGVFKTTDKGTTWTHIANTTLNAAVITNFTKGSTQLFLTSLSQGIFISEDNGNTWNDFNDINTLNVSGTNALTYNETTHELIINNDNGIFHTSVATPNPMASYTSISTGLPTGTIIHSLFNNGTSYVLATNKGVFTKGQNVLIWDDRSAGLKTLNVNTALIFQGMLIAGTRSEGVFKGTDSTTPAWTAVSFGFNNLITHAMVCNGVALVVAATEKGVFVSTDLANSYKAANKGLIDSLNVTDLVLFGHKLFASTKNAGVFMSADTGATWTIFNSSLMAIDIKKLATSSSYIYLITTNNYVYYSDGTNSWNMANNGLPTGVPFTSLTFYGNQVAIGTLGNGVYKSVAGQNKWSSFNNGLSNLNVTSLTAQNTKLFAGTDGNGVFVSDTIAANWMNTSKTTIPHTTLMGLNGQKIEAMATYAGYVWASYKGGLLATSDYGTTWIAGGNQFNLPSYTHVYKVDFVTTRVFVTTENNGLYSNALSEIPPANGINELGNNIGNFNVFPNPSNGNIYIDLTTLKGKVNEINVYNQQGKKVTSFQQAALPGTPFQLQLASGIYFIQAITRDGAATQKVIIH